MGFFSAYSQRCIIWEPLEGFGNKSVCIVWVWEHAKETNLKTPNREGGEEGDFRECDNSVKRCRWIRYWIFFFSQYFEGAQFSSSALLLGHLMWRFRSGGRQRKWLMVLSLPICWIEKARKTVPSWNGVWPRMEVKYWSLAWMGITDVLTGCLSFDFGSSFLFVLPTSVNRLLGWRFGWPPRSGGRIHCNRLASVRNLSYLYIMETWVKKS